MLFGVPAIAVPVPHPQRGVDDIQALRRDVVMSREEIGSTLGAGRHPTFEI